MIDKRLAIMIGALYGVALGFFVTALVLHATRPHCPRSQVGQPQ